MTGDYEGTLGIPDFWANEDERNNDKLIAQIIAVIFVFLVVQLFLAIVFTINTDPGGVPQDHEFDLPDELIGRTLQGRGGLDVDGKSTGELQGTPTPMDCEGGDHEKLLNDDIV